MGTMRARSIVAAIVVFSLWSAGYGYQKAARERRSQSYEHEMQSPAAEDPPDAWEEAEFAFARLRYHSGGFRRSSWGTDSNTAERHLILGIRRLSRIHARSVEEIIEIDTDQMYNWPWLYAVEVGRWQLNEPEAKRIRDYLDRGGFLMVDDFHGEYEWENFMRSFRLIFPDRQVVDLEDTNSIFHTIYNLDQKFQVPGYQYVWSHRTYERYDGQTAHWRGVLDDKGRVQVAICHNSDLGDAWEWSDSPEYPEPFAGLAYRIGLNYIVYAMSH
jgi:hypothetical protein